MNNVDALFLYTGQAYKSICDNRVFYLGTTPYQKLSTSLSYAEKSGLSLFYILCKNTEEYIYLFIIK